MREQIRLWFYSQLFMSVALVDRAPFQAVLGYEKMLDEQGREMHGSWGNMIDAEEAFERMGADVMRWQYCAQPPNQNLLFGYGPAHEIKRRLLTFWNSVAFLVTYANIEKFEPRFEDLATGPTGGEGVRPLDRWLVARTQELVAEATEALEKQLTFHLLRAFERFVDDLSNWYIRRSRKRFYSYDEAAFRTLWYALLQAIRVVSPVMPFLAEHLWRELVGEACVDAPESVFLAGWPETVEALADPALLAEVDEVREIVELGRQVRAEENIKLRQPLRRAFVHGSNAVQAHADEIRAELRVKEVELHEAPRVHVSYKPNLRILGPKLGTALPDVKAALEHGEVEPLPDGGVRAADHELAPEELLIERAKEPGWAHSERFSVGLDTHVDDELELEGRVLDLIHSIQRLRKEAGLEITDRIVLTLPEDGDLLRHEEWIKSETLATRIEHGPELSVAKA